MSNKSAAYNSYLTEWKAANPSIVEPAIIEAYTPEAAALARELSTMEILSHSNKYWTNNAVAVYRLTDGRIVETMVGKFSNTAAVFPDSAAYYAWKRPMSCNEFWHG
jgi:hypothetical protein